MSKELRLLNFIDRFGVEGVLGRTLGASEIRRMASAESIATWYEEQYKAQNIVEWQQSNPEKAEALHEAYKLAVEMKLIEE